MRNGSVTRHASALAEGHPGRGLEDTSEGCVVPVSAALCDYAYRNARIGQEPLRHLNAYREQLLSDGLARELAEPVLGLPAAAAYDSDDVPRLDAVASTMPDELQRVLYRVVAALEHARRTSVLHGFSRRYVGKSRAKGRTAKVIAAKKVEKEVECEKAG